MKKIVFIILSFFIYCSAFANTILDLKTDKNKVKLNESIVLTLDVKTDSPGNIEIIDIIGLDNFIQLGQSSSTNISIINGKSENNYKLKFTLKTLKAGKFFLGPINLRVGNGAYGTKQIRIVVEENNNTTVKSYTPPIKSVKKKDLVKNDNNTKQDEEKDDIRAIKDNIFFLDKLVLFPMIFFIFVYFFYVVLHKFLELKEDRKINKQLNPLLLLNERKNKIILDLANIDINKSRSEFYCNLNGIFRDYFDLINIKGIDNSTLKEIKKLDIDIDLLAIFEQSYLNEFCDVTDRELDIKQRKQIIYKFISYIKG